MPRRFLALLSMILCAALASAPTAEGQDAPELSSEDREARALYLAGAEALRSGRYENALDYFQRSYELSGRAEMLYNVGIAADRMRRDELALSSFERYLAELPEAPNRDEVEARIAALRGAMARTDAAPEPEPDVADGGPSTAGSTTASDDGSDDPTGWILVGVGAALAVTGAILWGVGAADAATVENAADGVSWETLEGPYNRAPILSVTGAVSLAVGAGLATVGLVIALSGGDGGSSEVAIGPGGVTLRGTF